MNLGDTIAREAVFLSVRAGGGYVYCSKPFSCGVTEAVTHLSAYEGLETPDPRTVGEVDCAWGKLIRLERSTTLLIKPRKGTGKRKPYSIRLWA